MQLYTGADNWMKLNEEIPSSPANMETVTPQIEMIQISPPVSIPTSPAVTPVIQILSSPNPAFNANTTNDPNWQASKLTIRERNAAMFDNELMADVHFLVGNPGKSDVVTKKIVLRQ